MGKEAWTSALEGHITLLRDFSAGGCHVVLRSGFCKIQIREGYIQLLEIP
jgi:c-di-GMP-binding flagellar brake protein YcgR